MGNIIERIGTWWCTSMHSDPMWPIAGRYRCRECHREYEVGWSEPAHLPVRPKQPTFIARLDQLLDDIDEFDTPLAGAPAPRM